MQCGFAMVETGFTRAKNAVNIIMKNLMYFCIGTVVFSLLGFGLMMSEDYVAGFIGVPNLSLIHISDRLSYIHNRGRRHPQQLPLRLSFLRRNARLQHLSLIHI